MSRLHYFHFFRQYINVTQTKFQFLSFNSKIDLWNCVSSCSFIFDFPIRFQLSVPLMQPLFSHNKYWTKFQQAIQSLKVDRNSLNWSLIQTFSKLLPWILSSAFSLPTSRQPQQCSRVKTLCKIQSLKRMLQSQVSPLESSNQVHLPAIHLRESTKLQVSSLHLLVKTYSL